MANANWYRAGTVTLAAGSTAVVGVDTSWSTQVNRGDLFLTDGTRVYEVDSVTDNTHLVLKTAWAGAAVAGASYAIIRNFTGTPLGDFASDLATLINRYELTLDEQVQLLTSTAATMQITNTSGLPVTVPTWAGMLQWINGRTAKDVSAGGTIALTAADMQAGIIELTGSLPAAVALQFPAGTSGMWMFIDSTTRNSKAITVAVATGAAFTLPAGAIGTLVVRAGVVVSALPTPASVGAQPADATLAALAGLATAADQLVYATGSDAFALTALTALARTLLAGADTATMRTTLGLGTMATQASNAVSITGGNITGLTVSPNGGARADVLDFNALTSPGVIEFTSAASLSTSTNAPPLSGVGVLEVVRALSATTARLLQRWTTTTGGFAWRFQDYNGTWSAWQVLSSMAQQSAGAVAIAGGAIDGAAIGNTTPSTGKFTTLQTTGIATIGGNRLILGTDALGGARENGGSVTLLPGNASQYWHFGNYGGALSFRQGATFAAGTQTLSLNGTTGRLVLGAGTDDGVHLLQVGGPLVSSGPALHGVYTLSTLPSAAAYANHLITVSDATGGRKVCQSDGSNWKLINTTTTVS